jgi:predicted  nucleic acid-binding Zn-ribbon protein
LSVCSRCGTEVTKPSKTGEQIKLTLGLFVCPECERRFQTFVEKEKERITLKGIVEEIKGVEKGLVHTLGDLREKIEKLKDERAELLEEIEELRRAGKEKASTLEEEVSSLREEVEALKEMLSDLE